jgi:hypothetical protein
VGDAHLAAAVYADGGLCGRNPSPHGGSWAFVYVDALENVLREASGFVTPAEAGLPYVTNNYTELLAVTMALEGLPAGWAGKVFTDSFVTYNRLLGSKSFKGIPPEFVARFRAAVDKLGPFIVGLLSGHPRPEDLEAGHNGGVAVSEFNVRCDELCCLEVERFKKRVK